MKSWFRKLLNHGKSEPPTTTSKPLTTFPNLQKRKPKPPDHGVIAEPEHGAAKVKPTNKPGKHTTIKHGKTKHKTKKKKAKRLVQSQQQSADEDEGDSEADSLLPKSLPSSAYPKNKDEVIRKLGTDEAFEEEYGKSGEKEARIGSDPFLSN